MFTVREAIMNKAVTADPRRKQFNIHKHYKQRKHLGCITGDSCWFLSVWEENSWRWEREGWPTSPLLPQHSGRSDLLFVSATSRLFQYQNIFICLYRCFTEFHLHYDFSNGQNNYHHCVDKDLSPTFHPSNYKFLWNNLCKVKQASKTKPGC